MIPAIYSIHIERFLDESWSERLAGIDVKTIKMKLSSFQVYGPPSRDLAEGSIIFP